MRVIGYIRVSTEEQAVDGVSLESQRAKVEGYCTLYCHELVEIFEGAGESAKSLKRPKLSEALAMLRTRKVDGLVIAKLDRLTRNVGDWQILIDRYFGERAGKQLFSVADSIDTTTAGGRLVLNVLLSVAQWEREAIAERTRDAMAHMIRNGERVSRSVFGYDVAEDGRTLIPNEAEQTTIQMMVMLRRSGYSLQQIAAELNQLGIKTKEGCSWQPMTVKRVLERAGRNDQAA